MKNQKNKVIAMRLTPEDNQFIEEQARERKINKVILDEKANILKTRIMDAVGIILTIAILIYIFFCTTKF